MDYRVFHRKLTIAVLLPISLFLARQSLAQQSIQGRVLGGGAPISNSTVTLWEASEGAPRQLAQTKTNSDGRFEVRSDSTHNDAILYVIAAGGEAQAKEGSGENPAIVLLSVLGNHPPENVVVNELTTVASAFTAARFISGQTISGNPLGLRHTGGHSCQACCASGGGVTGLFFKCGRRNTHRWGGDYFIAGRKRAQKGRGMCPFRALDGFKGVQLTHLE
jgi:hypothetical protein